MINANLCFHLKLRIWCKPTNILMFLFPISLKCSSPNAKTLHYTRTTSQSGDSSSDDEFLPSLFNLEDDGLVKGVSTNFFDLLNKPVQPQKEKKLTPSSVQIKQLRYNMDDMFKSSEADKENNVPTNEVCKVSILYL